MYQVAYYKWEDGTISSWLHRTGSPVYNFNLFMQTEFPYDVARDLCDFIHNPDAWIWVD